MMGDPHVYTGTMNGIRKIAQHEGVTALYRGTSASLLMVRSPGPAPGVLSMIRALAR